MSIFVAPRLTWPLLTRITRYSADASRTGLKADSATLLRSYCYAPSSSVSSIVLLRLRLCGGDAVTTDELISYYPEPVC